MKRSIAQTIILGIFASFLIRNAAADTGVATAVLNAPIVQIGGNSDFEWGPLVSQGDMSLQGSSDVHYPQKFSGGAITATGGDAGNQTYCQNGPASDGKEYFCGLTPPPDYPHINFSDYRQLAQLEGKNCGGDFCLNPTNLGGINDPVCTVNGLPKVWFFDGSPSFSGSPNFCGVLVTLGSVSFNGGGGTFTVTPPIDAWKQYQAGTPAKVPDSNNSGEYPGDSGIQKSITPVTLSNVAFRGYIYTTNGYTTHGNATIIGAVQFGLGTATTQGNSSIYFSSQSVIVEPEFGHVDQPIIFPNSGCYSTSVTVSIIDGTTGASIYYTLDGSDPDPALNPSAILYSGSFVLSTQKTVRAIAVKSGMTSSATASQSYTFTGCTPPPVITFTAAPNPISLGGSSVLTWTTQNATSVSIDQGIGSVGTNGNKTVTPGVTTTYTLTATGPGGSNTKSVTVTVTSTPPGVVCGDGTCTVGSETCSVCAQDCGACPPTATLTANPTTVPQGSPSTLSWTSTNGTSASLDQGIGSVALNSSMPVTPSVTTTYTLTVSGAGGTQTAQATVTVTPPPPAVQFNASSFSANENDGVATITVTRTGADLSGASTIHFASADGTAKAGIDYLAVSGTLTFNSGDTSLTFEVPLIDDALVEGNETVNLTLSNPMNATLGTSNAVLTILDNDTTNPPLPPPAPFISELVPNTAPAGYNSNFMMRILGNSFATDAQVHWNFNGNDSVFSGAVVVSSTEIDVTVLPGQVSQVGIANVTVVNVSLALTSNQVAFTIRQPGNGYPPPFIGVPSANPNPTYTKTTTLTVQGGTLTGGTVSYTWSLAGTNPASNVTFTKNNSDGSSATATFPPTTGTVIYHLKATITDNQSQFSVDSVPVDVTVIQNATSLTVGPPNPTYTVGQAQPLNLTANIVDQWGIAMTAPTTWTESGGSLAPSGTTASFTNTDVNIGNVTVTATAVNALNLPVSGSRVVKIIVVGAGMGGDLSTARAYPVPWKSNGGDPYIHFTGLVSDTKIRIFSITGHIVQTLHSPSGCNGLSCDVPWDIKNANFDRVASGVYPFIIEGAGQKKEGKLVIIQ